MPPPMIGESPTLPAIFHARPLVVVTAEHLTFLVQADTVNRSVRRIYGVIPGLDQRGLVGPGSFFTDLPILPGGA